MENVSVVIPARNEAKHIAKVINVVKKTKNVNEIIVINNNSSDNTKEIAEKNGAIVYDCKKVGKGNAMTLGKTVATGDIILFIDADIDNYSENFIDKMVEPIINENYDFVKSTFERSGGRVTNLVAKPLLELTFPKLNKYSQPLSGIIAGKKSFFDKLVFEKDYGVDIGILIDAHKLKSKIAEVNIGKIKNDSQDWKNLADMSKQVTKAILKRKFKKKKKEKDINKKEVTI